jgi:hypothetical protein
MSISALDFCLYIGFSLYGHSLIGRALDLSGIFIFPSSHSMPLIYVVGNRSLYSRSNYVMFSIVFSSQ